MLTERRLNPLFEPQEYAAPLRARDLTVRTCEPTVARGLNSAWHSRLPYAQRGPWKVAFVASYRETAFAVALWHNPSARNLPQSWLELRRMAVAPDAPHCTASFFLARMTQWIRLHMPEVDRMISYQDVEVHKGTIYKAAGWTAAWTTKARSRDRSKARTGTMGRRDYRSNSNGCVCDAAAKIRWELACHTRRDPGKEQL